MARPSELVIGYCYFMLGYFDSELLVPGVTTLRYLGVDATGPERLWRFQSWGADDSSELVLTDEQLSQVSDLGGLMGELQALSLLHPPKAPASPSPPIAPDAPVLRALGPEIAKLMDDPAQASVTITIRFTDDGFSIGRSTDGALAATFFTHPLLDPAEEEKIIAFFGARGAKARVDYLADKGRTRILEFPLPADAASVARICGGLLTGVYAMRADDLLRYTWHAASKR